MSLYGKKSLGSKKNYRFFFSIILFTVLFLALYLRSQAVQRLSMITHYLIKISIKMKSQERLELFFYNALNPLFIDGSWRIGIKIDDVGVQNLHINRYVQVFLDPGEYKLSLSHVDVFTFNDDYSFRVGNETMYVRVYNGLISTQYEVQSLEPEDFRSKYRPVEVSL